eukprot:709914_1
MQVVARSYHTCALSTTNKVKCWGLNRRGQLGYGDTISRGIAPNEMGDSLPEIDFGTSFIPKQIAAGNEMTCALSTTNKVKCYGRNEAGQLGYGDTSDTRGNAPNSMGDNLLEIDLGYDFAAISTGLPTSDPMDVATAVPTDVPTTVPTVHPTLSPRLPTSAPTDVPTAVPTVHPTLSTRIQTSSPSSPSDSSIAPTVGPTDDVEPFTTYYHSVSIDRKDTDSVVTAVILILIGGMAFVGCGFYIWSRKRRHNSTKMIQKEVQQAVVIDEDERMDNEETTTRRTGDGSNQGSDQVRSMINSLKKVPLDSLVTKRDLETSGANDKVLDEIEGKGEKKGEMRYTHEGGNDIDEGAVKRHAIDTKRNDGGFVKRDAKKKKKHTTLGTKRTRTPQGHALDNV